MRIKWKLKAVLAEKEATVSMLREKTGLHRATVSKHIHTFERPARLDADTLMKYCNALDCQPGDLMEFVKES